MVSTAETDVEGDGCSDFDTDEDGFVDQCAIIVRALQTLGRKTSMAIPLVMLVITDEDVVMVLTSRMVVHVTLLCGIQPK